MGETMEDEERRKTMTAAELDPLALIAATPSTPTLNQPSFACVQENMEKATGGFSIDGEPLSSQKGKSPARPPNRLKLLSLKEINACILSSENVRIGCSVTIALVSCSVPHGLTKSNSVVASRPLYILILTDVTIVLARLLIMGRQEQAEEKEEMGHKEDDEYNWKGAFAVLEIGLVIYQCIRALFIDCSFYLVVVLCGLSVL